MIGGKSASGKTASLRNLKDPEGVIYLNSEAGKELPFPAKFKKMTVTHPLQVFEVFEKAEQQPKIHTIVVDSLTYLMDMYESMYVLPASNGMKAWSEYQQFFKKLMQQYVAKSTKNVIFTAHTMDVLNEGDMVMETMVKVKGALMNNGVESYFNNVISCKKVSLNDLEGQDSPLLTITPQEESLGFKYVYQTSLTKKTVNERIRGPMGLWAVNETFIDNDLQLVINRLHEYYEE
jgi:hypothetical protein